MQNLIEIFDGINLDNFDKGGWSPNNMRMAVLEVKEVVVMMVLLVLLKLLVAVSDQDSCSPRQHGGCWERC